MVYRLCNPVEIQEILNSKCFQNVGKVCRNNPKYNNHQYQENQKYLHFFQNYDSLFYLYVKKGTYICEYDIPEEILEKYKGTGIYLDRIFMEKLESVTEYAIPSEKIEWDYSQKVDRVMLDYDIEDYLDGKEVKMDTRRIWNETTILENEISNIREKIKVLNKKYLEVRELCPHEIVFKYTDNHPRKRLIEGTYYCPACGKLWKNFETDQIDSLPLKDSKVISLENISLLGTKENLDRIRTEVMNNQIIYYDSNISSQELALRMEEVLKDYQYDYMSPEKTFVKIKKDK